MHTGFVTLMHEAENTEKDVKETGNGHPTPSVLPFSANIGSLLKMR